MDRGTKDMYEIPRAWKRLEDALRASDPKQLAALRCPKRVSEQGQTTAWYAGHDGQQPRTRPLYRGFRLMSYAEGERAWTRYRRFYRRDWNDSWRVLGKAGPHRLLCFAPHSGVYEVDVTTEPYTKKRICSGLSAWLALATRACGVSESRVASRTS